MADYSRFVRLSAQMSAAGRTFGPVRAVVQFGVVITDRQLLRAAAARKKSQDRLREHDDEMARLVAQARREGRTVRQIATLLGMGASTVQDLTRRGRELLDQ